MPESNNIDNLRAWLRGCPALQGTNRFGVDYLSEKPTEYALYASPSPIKFHENVLGEEVPDDVQVQNFVFASKEPYGADIRQNLETHAFYQAVVEWVIAENSARRLPAFSGGTVKSIVPTLTAYPAQIGSETAKYQIQLKLTYRRN